jgi:hypothetical protein
VQENQQSLRGQTIRLSVFRVVSGNNCLSLKRPPHEEAVEVGTLSGSRRLGEDLLETGRYKVFGQPQPQEAIEASDAPEQSMIEKDIVLLLDLLATRGAARGIGFDESGIESKLFQNGFDPLAEQLPGPG